MNLLLLSAFLMGFGGSVHCVGMCGPLVLAMPFNRFTAYLKWVAFILYHSGRVASYAIIGVFAGFVGRSINWFGLTQILSIILGSIIVLSVLIPRIFKQLSIKMPTFINTIQIKLMQALVKKHQVGWMWLAGMLNGLLPCGLVYMAVAASLVSGAFTDSILFMTFFGLGTVPAMVLIVAASGLLNPSIKHKLRKIVPVVSFIIGVLLILRGLNLNIPFISPYLSTNIFGDTAIDCH